MSSTLVVHPPTSMRHRLAGHPVALLILLAAVIAWLGAAQQSLAEQENPLYAIFAASLTVLVYGWIGVPILSLALLPPMVVTMVLLNWIDPRSGGARFAIGGAAWAGWGFVIWLAVLSIPPDSRSPAVGAPALGLLVAAGLVGGLFSLFALGRPWRTPGRILVLTAVAVCLFVIGGTLVTGLQIRLIPG